ncbi:MAG: hypothetical protein M1600_12715 [Firmicutes bacterium]|jgi:hypothetical protein|nr:hypothetical protein [Bacillota bacterium]
MTRWLGLCGLLAILTAVLSGCGNPHAIGNMPTSVRRVLDTSTLAGINIATAMLDVTGNREDIGKGQLPGYFTEGPAEASGDYYVHFNIPVNTAGIQQRMGYLPQEVESLTIVGDVYMEVDPLPNEAYDRLYFNPSTQLASFDFKILTNGAVMDQSWDAVLVNS